MILTGMMIVIMIVALDKYDDYSEDSYAEYKILGMLGTFYTESFVFACSIKLIGYKEL
jgi:hypothetical protein